MNTMKYFAAMMASVLAVGCMEKNEMAPDSTATTGNKINLTIQVDYPQADPATKVAFGEDLNDGNGPQLTWTGDETMSVIIGKTGTAGNTDGTDTKEDGLQVTLNSIAPGIFSGVVDLGENFTEENIQGVAVPAEIGAFYRWNSDKDRMMIPLAAEQTQKTNGVFNSAYIPFVAKCTIDNLVEEDATNKTYKISNMKLCSPTDLVRFNVYGSHASMKGNEVLRSIKVIATNRITGEVRWDIGSTTGAPGSNSAGPKYVQVNYEGSETIPQEPEDGIKVFASVVLGGNRTITDVEVVTDKAVYTKTLTNTSLPVDDMSYLTVHKIGLNLSNFVRISEDFETSVDGGATWQSGLPAQIDGKLAVRTEEASSLTLEALTSIKTAIDESSAAVELDLSAVNYEETIFPDIFKGTSDEPNTTLKSIKFPSNVTEIAANAFQYCTALESVDLTGIETINTMAFYYAGLKTLNVPSSVTSIPGYLTFGCCAQLSEVFFDSPAGQVGGNGGSGVNHSTFAYCTQSEEKKAPNKVTIDDAADCIFTFGPNATVLTRYMFRYNTGIIKMVFQTNLNRVGNYGIQYMYNIQTFDFSTISEVSSGADPYKSDGSSYGYWKEVGKNHLINDRVCKILVPSGAKDAYEAVYPWADLIKNTYDTGKTDSDGNAIMSSAWIIEEVE